MLKIKLVSAASLLVLTSTALAACGSGDSAESKQADAEAAVTESKTQTAESAYASEEAAYAQAEPEVDQPSSYEAEDTATAFGAETLETEAQPETNYETAETIQEPDESAVTSTDPYASEDATQTAMEVDNVGATLASLTPMKASDVQSKEDVSLITDSAFEKADLNGDGALDRTEFATLSLAAAGEDPSMIETVLTRAEETATDIVQGVTGADAEAETEPGIESGVSLPAEEAAQVAALDEDFAESAGDDASMTKEELRSAFLARFEKADVNDNEQLEMEERETFAALTAGKKED